ncbi:helix-turn-helix domain-containing protein [Streptomyces sp. H10-C2]|uniref:winged helix-turn-helix transcriptional regulator n=1 Tax=unclassified Streptomyces TaxID=2593676 RepID=UPI0024B984F3|nr:MULTISPECIES: helix-turn-helix domain-containing protein [unclassified Streptomyces]MDJ0345867.1 helix-turn-helix domain-containing protein [Streptomyces sp. PH10-H1]MDJ0371167.1 helix-turn-helix domain-containing protein [Streptomyces sp. H10-C2]
MADFLEDRDDWSMTNCSVARALEIVGTRSAMLILREAFLGTRRFHDFARRVGIGEPVAAARLKELTAQGLLERVPYQEPGQRTRDEYRLTRKGGELLPVITALRQWGDDWAADSTGPSVRATHRECGSPVHARLRCDAGHDVDQRDIEITAGPGLIAVS